MANSPTKDEVAESKKFEKRLGKTAFLEFCGLPRRPESKPEPAVLPGYPKYSIGRSLGLGRARSEPWAFHRKLGGPNWDSKYVDGETTVSVAEFEKALVPHRYGPKALVCGTDSWLRPY